MSEEEFITNFKGNLIDYIDNLQQENLQLKQRIEKAIDWTIKYRTEWCQEDEVIRDLKQLLEILKGDNK